MRRYRGKAIAFGLVALVGATSTGLADAAEGPTAIPGPVLPLPGGSTRHGSSADPTLPHASTLGTSALGTVMHLGEPLQNAGQLLGRLSFMSDGHRSAKSVTAGAVPRPSLIERNAGPEHGARTVGGSSAFSGTGSGAALLAPTLSRVLNLISGNAATTAALASTAAAVPQDVAVPALALQVDEQGGEQVDEQVDEAAQEELAAAAHAAATEEAFQARPDAASAIAASAPQYVERPYVPGAPSEAALEQLRWCESGGNYAAISPGGWYRGAYQFDFSTWDSVASRWMAHLVGTDPAAAAPTDQDLLASALYSERGWQPWPNCGLGL